MATLRFTFLCAFPLLVAACGLPSAGADASDTGDASDSDDASTSGGSPDPGVDDGDATTAGDQTAGVDESSGSDSETGADVPALASFTYTITAELTDSYFPFRMEQHGVVHRPGMEQSVVDVDFAGVPLHAEMIRDGDCAFVRGELPWLDGTFSPIPYFALDPSGMTLEESLAGSSSTSAELDGEPMLRYELESAEFGLLAEAIGPVPDPFEPPAVSLWVDPDTSMPRRMEVTTEDPKGDGSWHLTVELDALDAAPPVTLPGQCTADGTGAAVDTSTPPVTQVAVPTHAGERSWTWDDVYTVIDVVVQSVTNGFSPKSVQESVEIVEEAAPSIKENVDNIERWREANPDDPTVGRAFREPDNDPEGKNFLYRWFWGLLQ